MENHDTLSFGNDKEIIDLFDPDEYLILSDTVYKFSTLKKKQKRNIVITNKCVFNLINKILKKKISIRNIVAITISSHSGNNEFILHIPSEHDYLYDSPKYFSSIVVGKL